MLHLSDGQATNPCFCFPSLLKRLVDFWPQIRALSPTYCIGGRERVEGREEEGAEREKERELGMSSMESWKALLLPHSTGYQGINRVLKALRGGRNGGFLERGKERFRMMERQRKTEERKGRGAERDGCIFSLCVSSAVTQCSALPLTRRQTVSGLAVNIKGDGLLFCPWS